MNIFLKNINMHSRLIFASVNTSISNANDSQIQFDFMIFTADDDQRNKINPYRSNCCDVVTQPTMPSKL